MPTKTRIDQNEIIIRHFFEQTINPGNLAAFDDLYDPHFVNHDTTPGTSTGIEGLKQHYRRLRRAFPDYAETIDSIITRGNTLVVRSTMVGTHQGEWKGIAPTGKRVKAILIRILRMIDGKVMERWGDAEPLGLMQQLEAIPPLGQSECAEYRPNRTGTDRRYF